MNNDLKKLAQYIKKQIEDAKEEIKDYFDESLADLQTDEETEEKDEFEDFEDEETPSDTLDLQEDDFEEAIEEVKAQKTNLKKPKVKVK